MNAKADFGGTALIWAVRMSHTDTAQTLLAHGADVNAKDESGITALVTAAWSGHSDTVETLLAHRADVVTAAQQLLVEAYKGDTAAVEALLAQGTDVNAQNGWTALMAAACAGRTDTAQTLLDRGARVNAKGGMGRTALMWAAWKGHTDTAQTLLAQGADVNAKNDRGWTALISAAQQGHADTAETLLAAGADVNAKDKYGWTALKGAEKGGHTDMVRLLKTTSVQQPSPPSKVKPPTTLPGKKEKRAAGQPSLDLRPGHVKLNPKDGLEYVWIPQGTFQMGCVPGDDECEDAEKPRHTVTISNGFWLGRTEVTVKAYKRFARETGTGMPAEPFFNRGWKKYDRPINRVTWSKPEPTANGPAAGCRPKRSGSTLPEAARRDSSTPGATTSALRMQSTVAKEHLRLATIPPTASGSTTWPATSGSGARTDTRGITTRSHQQQETPRGRDRERGGFWAAGRGATVQRSCARRSAAGSFPRTGSTLSGSGVPGKFSLDSFTLFTLPGAKARAKCF